MIKKNIESVGEVDRPSEDTVVIKWRWDTHWF